MDAVGGTGEESEKEEATDSDGGKGLRDFLKQAVEKISKEKGKSNEEGNTAGEGITGAGDIADQDKGTDHEKKPEGEENQQGPLPAESEPREGTRHSTSP